jgi:hypothetical protein
MPRPLNASPPVICRWCERTIPAKAAELWDDRPQCKNLNACDRASDRLEKARGR